MLRPAAPAKSLFADANPVPVQMWQGWLSATLQLLNLGTLDGHEWGFTGSFHKDNGGGFLTG
jgi:hypothetical protein